jgi:hypothetical protein
MYPQLVARRMGGAKRYPSIASYGDDGFRRLNPSYVLVDVFPWLSELAEELIDEELPGSRSRAAPRGAGQPTWSPRR